MKIKIYSFFTAFFCLIGSSDATLYQMYGRLVSWSISQGSSNITISKYVCTYGGDKEICAEITVNDGSPAIVICSVVSTPSLPIGTPISNKDFSGRFQSYEMHTDEMGNTVYEWGYLSEQK